LCSRRAKSPRGEEARAAGAERRSGITPPGVDPAERAERRSVVGTVTDFAAGKRIVVLTGDGSKHDYDLADKKTSTTVDRRVTVGTKEQLNLEKDDAGNRSIRVVPAAGLTGNPGIGRRSGNRSSRQRAPLTALLLSSAR
jgi:hypothetical protein